MGIDMFNLTTYSSVDRSYLEEMAEITEDRFERSIYKYVCKFPYGEVMWKPHKFSPETNDKIPYTKVDINPKYFFINKFHQSCLSLLSF
ncbi:MAG: hypothetical protein HZA08_04210 [Nitrospirae bacterium]|nr:hypothetical protein [Nitrospirota bacterium]